MKSWRERNAEAKARGTFNAQDADMWANVRTCPAAEVAGRYGVMFGSKEYRRSWERLWDLGAKIGPRMAVNDFKECDRILDDIEDLALEIKREL